MDGIVSQDEMMDSEVFVPTRYLIVSGESWIAAM